MPPEANWTRSDSSFDSSLSKQPSGTCSRKQRISGAVNDRIGIEQ
jgi:hypothetical protein